MRFPSKKNQSGTVLFVTMMVVFLITVTVMMSMGGLNHQDVMSRNDQLRVNAIFAASSEIGAHIKEVNANSHEADDELILDLLATRGVARRYDLQMEASDQRTSIPHAVISNLAIDADLATSVACPGESIGNTKVLLGTIHANAAMADTGIRSNQQQHFLYCWP